ncbi:hypothetical protein D3C75_560640 [compost metagenome]
MDRRRTFTFERGWHHRKNFRTGIQARQLPQGNPGTFGRGLQLPGQAWAPVGECLQAGFTDRAHLLGHNTDLIEKIEIERHRLADLCAPGFANLLASDLRVLGVGDEAMQFHERWSFFCVGIQPVGASLLAIAVGQSTSMLDVMTSSRAGSLLQVPGCGGVRVYGRKFRGRRTRSAAPGYRAGPLA